MPQLIKTKALSGNVVDETKVRLSNDAFLRGRNNADNADVNIAKVNASDELEFGKLPYGPNSNAPVADAQLANKKYVDDQIAEFSGALTYRGSLAAGSDLTGNATGNTYLDSGAGLVQGDYFKITGSGLITTSDGTIAVDAGDALIANKNVASDAAIVNVDLDKIDNTEASDILRSGDLSATQIFVGNASNEAAAVSMSGDVALSNAGVATIQASAVTTAKINDGAVTEAKLDSGVDAETFVIAAGYDAGAASGDVSVGNTIQTALAKVEKKANDALAGAALDPEVEVITLTSTEVTTNKYFDLSFKAKDDELLSFKESGGAMLVKGVDYTTADSGGGVTRISWNALGLDGYAEVGDVWQVSYIKG